MADSTKLIGDKSGSVPLLKRRFASAGQPEVRSLRREMIGLLRLHVLGDFDAVELIYGELISNVVRHAPGSVKVELDWFGDTVVLIVGDEAQPFAVRAELPKDPLSERGRGMFIVKTLAEALDVRDVPGDGTEVRVLLPVRRAHSTDEKGRI